MSNFMQNEKLHEAEGGMIRGLLGYQLLHLAAADLVLFVRGEDICFTINTLMREGWSNLVAIQSCDSEDHDDHVLLTYCLRSNDRLHKIIDVQVLANRHENWRSVAHIFANAKNFEDMIEEVKLITFI